MNKLFTLFAFILVAASTMGVEAKRRHYVSYAPVMHPGFIPAPVFGPVFAPVRRVLMHPVCNPAFYARMPFFAASIAPFPGFNFNFAF